MKKPLKIAAFIGIASLPLCAGLAFAAKGELVPMRNMQSVAPMPLQITLGKADMISLPDGVSDVLVANPAIVDIQAVQSNKLYAVGLSIGDTNLIVLDGNGEVLKRVDIHVTYDLKAIQGVISQLYPNEDVQVRSVHDQILLTGKVSTPEVSARIGSLVNHYVSDLQDESKTLDELVANLLDVRGEQQVMLKVRIVEAERSILKELGVETNANDPNELSTTTLFGNTPGSSIDGTSYFGLAAEDGLGLSQDAMGSAALLLDTDVTGIGTLGLFINALEEENLVNVLAEPNLTAVSGQQAGFLAGGQFPVPAGRDQNGNITIEYREFGVSLNFRPVVMSDKRINLQLNTEVSSLDSANAVVLSDLTVPGLDVRRAETTIEIPSGGSLMIAGLLQSQTAQGLNGLPGIKDTPILGDLMSSDSFRRDETELVVIVTAYMVEPYAQNQTEQKKKKKEGQLAKIFSNNLRRSFAMKDEDVFDQGSYGYIVE